MDPNANGAGEGSSSRPSTVFRSIINPNKDEIRIPAQFLKHWKQTICAVPDGCIKDPANNFWNFATAKVERHNSFENGQMLARYCGITSPQIVIFKYEPEYNQFNMRFVDRNGDDVLYLGTHYPTNYHQMKLDDSSLEVKPAYYHTVTEHEDDECYIPVQFLELSFAACAANEDPDRDNVDHPLDSELVYKWEQNVSSSFAKGNQVLHFPKFVCEKYPFIPQQNLLVVNKKTKQNITCQVMKASTTKPQYHIGGKFYEFVKKLKLKADDKLHFVLDNLPKILNVEIEKAKPSVISISEKPKPSCTK